MRRHASAKKSDLNVRKKSHIVKRTVAMLKRNEDTETRKTGERLHSIDMNNICLKKKVQTSMETSMKMRYYTTTSRHHSIPDMTITRLIDMKVAMVNSYMKITYVKSTKKLTMKVITSATMKNQTRKTQMMITPAMTTCIAIEKTSPRCTKKAPRRRRLIKSLQSAIKRH